MSATGGDPGDLTQQLGELREVVVASRALPRGRSLRSRVVRRSLEVRRVPERFLPPDAISDPAQVVGRSPAAPIPAGGYLLASQLAAPASERQPAPRLPAGRRPVEIGVEGAGALAEVSGRGRGRVDVIVTSEPGPGGGAGRTYVAARGVDLLDLRPAGGETGSDELLSNPASESWIATLGLTRDQALRLIQAESFARSVRLIGR